MNNINDLKESIPSYASDIKLNLSSLIKNSEFDDKLVYGCAYASSLASGGKNITKVFESECLKRFDDSFVESVKSTVAIMSLNNVWYKFRDAMPNNEMKMAPQRMRVNIMRDYAGLDKILFETFSLCISAVNGCNFCIKSHTELLLENGKSKDYIYNIGRIASIVVAASKIESID